MRLVIMVFGARSVVVLTLLTSEYWCTKPQNATDEDAAASSTPETNKPVDGTAKDE